MVEVIRLHGDPHRRTQQLLAWYVNGTLEHEEIAMVEAHLADCDECRGDLRLERMVGQAVATLPTEEGQGWMALRGRIESRGARRGGRRWPSPPAFLGRPVPIGWAVAAQAASLALIAGLGWTALRPTAPAYVTLGAVAKPALGNLVVIFQPTTSERQLRGALEASQARLVDGPTASDAYVLHVDAARRSAALAQLRSNAHILLAEPIDGDVHP